MDPKAILRAMKPTKVVVFSDIYDSAEDSQLKFAAVNNLPEEVRRCLELASDKLDIVMDEDNEAFRSMAEEAAERAWEEKEEDKLADMEASEEAKKRATRRSRRWTRTSGASKRPTSGRRRASISSRVSRRTKTSTSRPRRSRSSTLSSAKPTEWPWHWLGRGDDPACDDPGRQGAAGVVATCANAASTGARPARRRCRYETTGV